MYPQPDCHMIAYSHNERMINPKLYEMIRLRSLVGDSFDVFERDFGIMLTHFEFNIYCFAFEGPFGGHMDVFESIWGSFGARLGVF